MSRNYYRPIKSLTAGVPSLEKAYLCYPPAPDDSPQEVAVDASGKIKAGRFVLTCGLPGRYNSLQERSKRASILGLKDIRIGHLLLRVFIRLPGQIRHENGRLAQWLEHLLHTQGVSGSSPLSPTILYDRQNSCPFLQHTIDG